MDLGVIVFVVALVVVMPVGILTSMAGLAGLIGWLVGRDRDIENTTKDGLPNEYLELSDSNPYCGS